MTSVRNDSVYLHNHPIHEDGATYITYVVSVVYFMRLSVFQTINLDDWIT